MQSILEEWLLDTDVSHMHTHISKIDGCPCTCMLRKSINTVNLEISAKIILNTDQIFNIGQICSDTGLSKDVPVLAKKLDKLLQDLRFCNMYGIFINSKTSKNKQPIYKALYDMTLNNRNVEVDFAECCVCYLMTRNKTPCKHYMCIKCISIQKDIIEDQEDYDEDAPNADCVKCPMCRHVYSCYKDSSY